MTTKTTFHIFKETFTPTDVARIDERIKPFLEGWKAVQNYKGKIVNIPGTWNSEIYPYKYFEVIKEDTDPNNPGEEENEIQCYISVGWRGYDDEIIIILGIFGKRVLSGENKVSAEILKPAGADIKLYYKERLVTDFLEKSWLASKKVYKVYVPDMTIFLKPSLGKVGSSGVTS